MMRPYNFSWVVEDALAGFARPILNRGHYDFLAQQGIRHIVSLTEDKPERPESARFKFYHIPVYDFEPPSIKQIKKFISIVKKGIERNEPVGVHCRGGLGRTGTMLACFLLVNEPELTGEEAIDKIRQLRPWSIESEEQEEMIIKFAEARTA